MARAVWIGSISFGLVNIPVRLYPATRPRDPRFHLVDRRTGRRVRYRRVVEEPVPPPEEGPRVDEETPQPPVGERGAPVEAAPTAERPRPPVQREVDAAEVVRGYEVEPGQHVMVEPEELEALRPEPTRAIEIEHFVSLADIDPVYFEKSYHLAPADDVAEKPYALLRTSMERSGRVAVGRFVLRTREHLALVRPTLGILGLETLYLADEVAEPLGRWHVAPEVSGAEVEMAGRLIEALTAEWDPSSYSDPYRERVLELIRSREPREAPVEEEAPAASVTDLMEALKASVDAIGKERSHRRSARRRAGGKGPR